MFSFVAMSTDDLHQGTDDAVDPSDRTCGSLYYCLTVSGGSKLIDGCQMNNKLPIGSGAPGRLHF